LARQRGAESGAGIPARAAFASVRKRILEAGGSGSGRDWRSIFHRKRSPTWWISPSSLHRTISHGHWPSSFRRSAG